MRKGEDTKQKILKHTLRLFTLKGYEETSLRDIAFSVDIKPPSIYAYFSSKEALFKEIMASVIDDCVSFIHHVASTIELLSIQEKIYHLFKEISQYFYMTERGIFLKRYSTFPPGRFKDIIHQYNIEFENKIRTLLYKILETEEDDSKLIDKETIVTSFICFLDGMLSYVLNHSYDEYENRLHSTWEVFCKGILK
ncbi:TetR/AcrR family transcriptional regulator [Bacillus thuringiensis]|uniref:TetR/AcrR family transcriptional regulator n=1 Tax=Bacillus thuringiensis TaxID=1428 RepID=UPI001481F3D8|nr:TetR/AcrR family transcriptional regulator [Bacillus thuringiensis]